jgi:hypothetical protein
MNQCNRVQTSAKPPVRRSGVSAERRKPFEIQGCGFLPKAATLLLKRFQFVQSVSKISNREMRQIRKN